MADESAINPEQISGSGEEEEGHGLLEGLHPCTGAREHFHQGGEKREDEIGQREADGHEREASEKLEGWKSHRGSDGGSEEWCGARGGDDRGEYSREKRTGVAALALEFSADGCCGGAELKESEHVQAEDEHEEQQNDDDPWVLELVAPADGFPEGEKNAAEDGEGDEDAAGESDAMQCYGAAIFPGLLDEAHDF